MVVPIIARIGGKSLGKVAKKTFNNYRKRALAKVNRLNKKGVDVSPYLDFSLEKEINFNSRKEYNAWKKAINKFTDRNNHDFKVKKQMSIHEITGIKTEFNYLNIERKELAKYTRSAIGKAYEKQEQLKNLPLVDSKGNVISRLGNQLEVLKDKERGFVKPPSVLDVDRLPSREVLLKRLETMKKRSTDGFFDDRNTQMRENFISLLRSTYGDQVDDIVFKLNNMDLDDFVDLFFMSQDMDFALYYAETQVEENSQVSQYERLAETVDNFQKGIINRNLNGFKNF